MRLLPVLAALAFTGCVTPPAPNVEDPSHAGPLVVPWTLTDCRYIVGWSEADPAVIQQNLPEGFLVSTSGPMGLPAPGPAARAIVGTEAFECASGDGLDGLVEPMLYASIWIPVTPPDALADPEVEAVYYKIDILVPDAPRREAMAARGLPVGTGEIAWTQPPIPSSRGAAFTIEGAGDFGFEMIDAREVSAGDTTPFMEITPAGELGADGFAVWRAAYEWPSGSYFQGRGFIDWPADHWVVDAIGMARAPAAFHAGTWSFNGTLSLP